MKAKSDWPTRAEMLVMNLLADQAGGMYGLEIVEGSKGKVKRGSVYVLLARLEEKGFVKSTAPKGTPDYPGLPRPTYRLTAVGTQVLAAAEQLGLAVGV
jgi:DNA-binding PadR family transcriptional regulator